MKKLYLLTGLLIFVTNITTAQEKTALGLKAGLNYSSFINNKDGAVPADYQGKAGFHAGGFVNFRLAEKLFIRPEVLFSLQGSEFEIDAKDTNVNDPEDPIFISDGISGKIKESVILVPVMAGVFVTENLDIELGPQLAWVVNRDVTYENNPYPLALIRNDDSGDFEFGVNAGLGYNFRAHYRIGLRYIYGITERQNLHSSVFQLGLHYTL